MLPRKELWVLLFCVGCAFTYEVGSEYKYSYKTTVLLRETCGVGNTSETVGKRLLAEVLLTSVWINPHNEQQSLMKIQISNVELQVPKKSVFTEHPSELGKSSKPSYLLLENGVSRRMWEDPKEHFAFKNLKRGIASMMQFQKTSGNINQADVSGVCDVTYEVEGQSVRKTKRNCHAAQFDPTSSQPPGIRSIASFHDSVSEYDLSDNKNNVIASCRTKEKLQLNSNTWKRPQLCIDSSSNLVFEGIKKSDQIFKSKDINDLQKEIESSLPGAEESSLEAVVEKEVEKPQKTLAESITKMKDNLKTNRLANLKSSIAFYKLLPVIRAASSKKILELLANSKLKEIKPQILDLVAASLTEDSVKAAFQHFGKIDDYDELLERYLIGLSAAPRQFPFMLREIKSFTESVVRHDKVHATLKSTLGILLKKYASNDHIADRKVVDSYRSYLEDGLKGCSTDDCKLPALRALRNAGLSQSAPLLIKYVSEGGKVALEAISAIKNIPIHQLEPEIIQDLLKIFKQINEKQDRSTRAIAAEILLKKSSDPEVLRVLLRSLQDQTDPEFSTHLASKILYFASKDQELHSRLVTLLPEKDIAHYYSLGQKGSSAVLSKNLMTAEDLNVTYSLEMEMLTGGLMKRSIFDVTFENELGTTNFLTVGIFAEGLASLAGEEGEETSEEVTGPTAGMELTLLDFQLRPYVFFSSTSELMGHAWSGTASEPTPALQGIYAFSDDERVYILSNGMPVRIQLRGILSVDSSGSIQVSLWSRNSASIVKNAGALFMRGSGIVDSGFAKIQGAIQFSAQSSIDFKTDTNFASSPFKICMKMNHPPITVKYDIHRSVSVDGSSSKFHLKKSKKRKRQIGGRCFPLHKRNSDMCTLMDEEL